LWHFAREGTASIIRIFDLNHGHRSADGGIPVLRKPRFQKGILANGEVESACHKPESVEDIMLTSEEPAV
jgi:hypothetical protein